MSRHKAKVGYRARRGRESFKRFEATQSERERGTLLKSTVEATSLGLKTKSGLRPNSRKYRGFIYKWVPVLKIDPRIRATRKCGSMT